MTLSSDRLRRTVLMTPGDQSRLIEHARRASSDVVWLDLEDAVDPARKAVARKLVTAAMRQPGWACRELIVRINSPADGGADDLDSLLASFGTNRRRLDGIVVPKVECAGDVLQIAERLKALASAETQSDLPMLWCLIETPRGLLHIAEIATQPSVTALLFGAGAIRVLLGMSPTTESWAPDPLDSARLQLVTAARTFGKSAIDSSYPFPRDESGTHDAARRSFALGFDGKLLVTPRQVEPVVNAWGPSAAELAAAQATLSGESPGTQTSDATPPAQRRMQVRQLDQWQAERVMIRARASRMAE